MTTPISVGEWNALVARRHERLLFCPVTHEKCKGEACEWWDVEELGCAGIRVAKSIATRGDDER